MHKTAHNTIFKADLRTSRKLFKIMLWRQATGLLFVEGVIDQINYSYIENKTLETDINYARD